MGLSLTVRDLSGKRVASTWNASSTTAWMTVQPVIAEWFSAADDEIGIEDTDDGDFVTVCGKRVAVIEEAWDRVPEPKQQRSAA